MFLLLITIAIFLLVIQAYKLLEVKKHDKHLFRFCNLRREAVKYLSCSYQDLSRNDYIALRKTIETLNGIIGSYKEHKTVVFNFRLFVRYLNDLKEFEKTTEKISTNNEKIKDFIRSLHKLIFKAFLAYTPYFKSEIAFYLIVQLFSFGVRAGVNSLKDYLSSLEEAKKMVNAFNQSVTSC